MFLVHSLIKENVFTNVYGKNLCTIIKTYIAKFTLSIEPMLNELQCLKWFGVSANAISVGFFLR